MGEAEIISQLLTVSPVVGVLIYFILYFRGELKRKDEEIKLLNNELRESGKEFIAVMKDVKNTLEALSEKINSL